jgi:hypothetical protein
MRELTPKESKRLCDLFFLLYKTDRENHKKIYPKCPYAEVCSSCTERLSLAKQLCGTLLTIKTKL